MATVFCTKNSKHLYLECSNACKPPLISTSTNFLRPSQKYYFTADLTEIGHRSVREICEVYFLCIVLLNRCGLMRCLSPVTVEAQCQSASAAWFTNYVTTVLRLSCDNASVTIDLRRTSNLSNILQRMQGQFLRTIYTQNHKIVLYSVREFAYDIPKRDYSTLYVAIISRSYDKS